MADMSLNLSLFVEQRRPDRPFSYRLTNRRSQASRPAVSLTRSTSSVASSGRISSREFIHQFYDTGLGESLAFPHNAAS